jgi:epoxyqueuosine reductase
MIGVAEADPFVPERRYLEQRKSTGSGPNPFEEGDIEKRTNPSALLPGVRSIIAGGVSYLMSDDSSLGSEQVPRGWLSRYCRGLDYHNVLTDRLEQLCLWLHAQVPDSESQVYVDTGPPLERAVALRAGLGKFGKSTMLITPKLGTWTFLGQIYTTVAIAPDEPLIFNACGSCTRCIDVCPTQCISDWQLDANRCLGYINQMDGMVPAEYREVMGDRLFGCDDCQDVCPYNVNALKDLHSEFKPIPEITAFPNLIEIIEMNEKEFDQKFAPTAAAWRGLETLQRNALIALGNSNLPQAFKPLSETLSHRAALLRGHAAWGLAQLSFHQPHLLQPALARLNEQLKIESHDEVLRELREGITILQQKILENSHAPF